MNKLAVSCSVKPVGSRGFLIPSTRSNPRFSAGTAFYVKEFTTNGLFIKFRCCNSIFAISENKANAILGMSLDDYKSYLSERRSQGLKSLAKALSEMLYDGKKK